MLPGSVTASMTKACPCAPFKTHPETDAIYTPDAVRLSGMSEEESATQQLPNRACQAPRVYKHNWAVGDIVVWDNRCLMHRACPYDTSFPRVLRGSRIAGDRDTELAPTFADALAERFAPAVEE